MEGARLDNVVWKADMSMDGSVGGDDDGMSEEKKLL
jgi:hypothetical protein